MYSYNLFSALIDTTASSSLVRPTFEQAEFPLKVIDIDETEENESFKGSTFICFHN